MLVGLDGGAPVLLLSAGLMIGLFHAFEPDHVTAVTTQMAKMRRGTALPEIRRNAVKSCLLGAFWGFGHTSMILLVSVLILAFSLSIPGQVFDGFEFVVGAMLVILGLSVYTKRGITRPRHSHPHIHGDGTTHSHPHSHGTGHLHGHKSYLIGCVHGIAGSGGIIALSAPMLGDIQAVLAFVLVFGAGSIVGMMVASGALSVPFGLARNFERLQKITRLATGTVSIIIGVGIMYSLQTLFAF